MNGLPFKRFGFLLTLLIFSALANSGTVNAEAKCIPDPQDLVAISISHVFDGDSLKLTNGRQIRIIGINTPEQGEFLADKARQVLRNNLQTNKNKQIVYMQQGKDKRDSYGRILAHLWISHQDGSWTSPAINLLKQGLAFNIAIAPNLQYLPCYAEAEAQAKLAKRGLWAKWRPIASSSRNIKPGFTFIQGDITSITDKGRAGSELIMAGNKLGLWIPAKSYKLFGGKNGLQSLIGKSLIVRGWVYKYKKHPRLQLEVSHPAMMSVSG